MSFKEWEKIKLEDHIDIKHGFAFKGEFFSVEKTNCILLTPGNFKVGGGFKDEKFKYYNGDIPKDYILKEGDIIVSMTDLSKEGDTIGYSAKIPKHKGIKFLHNQRLGLLKFKTNKIDSNFTYWLMRTSEYQNFIRNSATGTTVRHTSPSRIKEFEVSIPKSKEIQSRIACILSSLDDKIELNRQTNQTLEAIAKALFKEWFIDFNFPGATGEMQESELGEIPKGWGVGKLHEIVELNPKLSLKKGTWAKYVEMKDLSEDGLSIKRCVNRKFSSGSRFQNGDTLFARISPCLENGKTGFVDFLDDFEIGWGSTEFIVLRSKLVPPSFVYLLSRLNKFREFAIQSMVGSSGRQRVIESILADYSLVIPTNKILEDFQTVSKQLFETIKNNHEQAITLEALRDYLLPKLMKGEIELN